MTDLQTLTRKPPSGSTQPQRGPHHEICDAICHEAEADFTFLTVSEFRARANAHIHALKAAKAA